MHTHIVQFQLAPKIGLAKFPILSLVSTYTLAVLAYRTFCDFSLKKFIVFVQIFCVFKYVQLLFVIKI